MKQDLWHKALLPAVILLTAGVLLAACGTGKYEAIDLPSVETVEADIQPTVASESESKAPEFRSVDETVYVEGSRVNFRRDSSSKSEVIDSIPVGTELKRTGIGDIWSRVTYQGQTGYVANKYLSKEKTKN